MLYIHIADICVSMCSLVYREKLLLIFYILMFIATNWKAVLGGMVEMFVSK
jgi:hypothetical protein